MHRKLAHHTPSQLNQARAWFMRHNLSPAEARLWQHIGAGKLGVAVKRQVPVGKYIVDFLIPSAHLAIEIDGRHHERRRAADARRDRTLARLGCRVLRIEAELVHRALPEALGLIVAALEH